MDPTAFGLLFIIDFIFNIANSPGPLN
jgi:hypothetical protein